MNDGEWKILETLWPPKPDTLQSRRLIRDHEVKIEHPAAMIYLSIGKRMPARISR